MLIWQLEHPQVIKDPLCRHVSHFLPCIQDKCMPDAPLTQTNVPFREVFSDIMVILHRAPVIRGSIVKNKLTEENINMI